jgi:hypothetical protein
MTVHFEGMGMQRDVTRIPSTFFLSLAVTSMTCLAQTLPAYRAGSLTKQEPQSIYAVDPQDAWNRISYLLFTRTVKLRLADNFKEGAPSVPVRIGTPSQTASVQSFERIESGDCAIDPLYPSFFNSAGVESVLIDPQYQQFKNALRDALSEQATRPPLQRALMQADAWAAFDILHRWQFGGELGDRRNELLPMLAQFVRKLALTPQEIAALPDTYAAAQRSRGLPPLFDKGSGWIEVEWFPDREHDRSADYRRAARVFVKPRAKPQQFLDRLSHLLQRNPGLSPELTGVLDGVALVTEDLLIESNARVERSPVTFEVQVRSFVRDSRGTYVKTTVVEYELSRKLLLASPSSGGLVRVDPDDPAYLPTAGNDYTFASPRLGENPPQPPILGTLRRRCEACHGQGSGEFFTFARVPLPEPWRPPAVRQLRSADDLHAGYVVEQKMKRADFESLTWAR